jgi:hypothetical protein
LSVIFSHLDRFFRFFKERKKKCEQVLLHDQHAATRVCYVLIGSRWPTLFSYSRTFLLIEGADVLVLFHSLINQSYPNDITIYFSSPILSICCLLLVSFTLRPLCRAARYNSFLLFFSFVLSSSLLFFLVNNNLIEAQY